MAKKKSTKKKQKTSKVVLNEKTLPQNILPFGERVEENKNIYIHQKVYKDIHKFTKNKTTNESGGMLIGHILEEFGKTNIIINGFIEAKYCEGTPTTLKFTHETWEYVHQEMEKKYPEGKIVGWIHTHPDFGIFLSEYDKFIHENFFKEDYQIAYVVDPIQKIEGFYFWINGKIEKCKGFYVYDKTDEKIDVLSDRDQEETTKEKDTGIFSFKNILIGILTALVILLFFSNMSQNKEIAELKQNQQNMQASFSQTIQYMQGRITTLTNRLNALHPTEENTDANTENNTNNQNNNQNNNSEQTTRAGGKTSE